MDVKQLLNMHSVFAHADDTINLRTHATKVQGLLSKKQLESTLPCTQHVRNKYWLNQLRPVRDQEACHWARTITSLECRGRKISSIITLILEGTRHYRSWVLKFTGDLFGHRKC